MKSSLQGVVAASVLGLATLVSGPVRAGVASTVVPGSAAQHALAVTVDGNKIYARACRAGARCSATGGDAFELPAGAKPPTVETIPLAGDKGLAVVRAPLATGGAWLLLLTASDASTPPTVQKKLSGTVEAPRGKVDGERYRRVLIREKTDDGDRVIIGKRYENATVCGRPAAISARELDPSDMTWHPTHARSLTPAAMKAAIPITASRADTIDVKAPSLLTATVASSAVGRARSGMTDGTLKTRWAEKRKGAGKGELISMNGSEDVAMTGFELVVRSTDAKRAAAPRTFFIATDKEVFHVTMPEDAGQAEPDQTYRVVLPKPVQSDCVAVVLEEGYTDAEHDQVGFAEFVATTELDGKSHIELASMLNGDDRKADAAKAMLARSGKAAVQAVVAAYDKLDRRGQGRALEVVESGSCSDTASFYVDRLLGRGLNIEEFEPDLEPLARRARAQLRGCRSAATTLLSAALAKEEPGKRRVLAARELADIAPAAAVGTILKVLADGSTAPKQSGAKDSVRRGLRRALAVAAQHKRAHRVVSETLMAAAWTNLSIVEKIDLLRALGKTVSKHKSAVAAMRGLLSKEATFRTRYLLLPVAAHLAKAGDPNATTLLREGMTNDKSAHIRARSAAVSGGIPALVKAMVSALSDKSPRVRQAALTGLTEAGTVPAPTESAIIRLLAQDKWTFVRIGAARSLARQTAGGPADKALIAALDDSSNKVRRAVLRALGERHTAAAGQAIHDIADNPTEPVSVRTAAIAALGDLCRMDSVDLLYKLALRAGYQQLPYDQPLGLAALAALGELTPKDMGEKLGSLRANDERVPRLVRSIAKDVMTRTGSCGAR